MSCRTRLHLSESTVRNCPAPSARPAPATAWKPSKQPAPKDGC